MNPAERAVEDGPTPSPTRIMAHLALRIGIAAAHGIVRDALGSLVSTRVNGQWECQWKVEAVAAAGRGDALGLAAAVDQISRTQELPWATRYWTAEYRSAWQHYVVDLPRGGDVTHLASEIAAGGCDHVLAANPSIRLP